MTQFLRRFEKILALALMCLLFYVFARLEFLVWNWSQYKSKEVADLLWAFLVGLRFDISAIAMNLIPLILWSFWPWSERREKFWGVVGFFLFAPFFLAFMIMNLGDTEFINFVGRRFSYDGLFIVNEIPGKVGAIFATYGFITTLNFLVMGMLMWTSWRILCRPSTRGVSSISGRRAIPYYIGSVFLVLLVVVLTVRGGLQKKPLNIVNAHVFAAPVLNNLVLNSTFTFVKSYGAQILPREVYFEDRDQMLKLLNGSGNTPSLLEGHRPSRKQNVVIILLESFGLEYMGEVNGVKGYTPFLDSLTHKGLFFKNGWANGRRSIEGVASVVAGIPALMNEPFISSHFSSNYFVGLGSVLTGQKYATSFFHGGNNGTMYFDSFAKSAGFEKYYGANEYPNPADNDGTWGIFDEPFFQFMKDEIDKTPTPFFAMLFTLTSHNPYRIPDQYKGRFPKGPHEILESIGYADYALKRFFEEAEKQPWFKDTLFVLTADHTGVVVSPANDNELARFRVPVLFYHPGFDWPKGVDQNQIVQHIDILPSILDFLNLENKEVNYLGRSIFVPGERTATLYTDNRYFLVATDYYLDWILGNPIKMYDLSDALQKSPLAEPAGRKQHLEDRLKASIQYFNEGMWDNRLYYPSGK